jgi:hypothetical protein
VTAKCRTALASAYYWDTDSAKNVSWDGWCHAFDDRFGVKDGHAIDAPSVSLLPPKAAEVVALPTQKFHGVAECFLRGPRRHVTFGPANVVAVWASSAMCRGLGAAEFESFCRACFVLFRQ